MKMLWNSEKMRTPSKVVEFFCFQRNERLIILGRLAANGSAVHSGPIFRPEKCMKGSGIAR